MELSTIDDKLLHFFNQFDHGLLSDPKNNPFIRVTLYNLSPINPHGHSFFRYITKPGTPAEHTESSATNMAASLTLEALYLTQKPSKVKPIEEAVGTCRGIAIANQQVIIVTVISNPDDSRFLCQTIIKEIQILSRQ